MGVKRKLPGVALAFGALAVVTACEPSPPPPAEGPKTPPELVSNAEYDAIVAGLNINDVNWILRKPLELAYEDQVPLPTGLGVEQVWVLETALGECQQYVEVALTNVDENLQVLPGPITVVDKYREQTAGCEGIVK